MSRRSSPATRTPNPSTLEQSGQAIGNTRNINDEEEGHNVVSPRSWFMFGITLAKGTTPTQLMAYLIATFMNICLFVFLNATQTFILTQILGIDKGRLGDASGTLSFADEVLSLAATWTWGLASDRLGRRLVYTLAFGIMSAAIALTPHVTSLYPQLLVVRLLFAVGGSAGSTMLTAVLADYAGSSGRGKLAGLVGLCSGSGALLALFVFMRIPASFTNPVIGLKVTYFLLAVITLGISILLYLLLRSWNYSDGAYQRDHAETARLIHDPQAENINQPGWLAQARAGLLAARNPKILLGYVGSFLARGDTVIITLFVPLWIYKRYIEIGQCQAPDPTNPDIKDLCHAAYVRASALSGVAQTFALVGAPVFGWLSDRVKTQTATLIASLTSLAGYLLIFFTDPLQGIQFLAMALVGFGEIGMIVTSLSLVTSPTFVSPTLRGAVAGVSSSFGALGILVTSKWGGLLFDRWTEAAPFFLLAIGNGFASVLALYCVYMGRRETVS